MFVTCLHIVYSRQISRCYVFCHPIRGLRKSITSQVEFSPFEGERHAVATAQYFGIVGNGRLHVIDRSAQHGLREVKY